MFVKSYQIGEEVYTISLDITKGVFICNVGDIHLECASIYWLEDKIRAYHAIRHLPIFRAIILYGMTIKGIDYKEELLCRDTEGTLVTSAGDTFFAEYVLQIEALEALESIQSRLLALDKQREDLFEEYHAIQDHYKIPLGIQV